MSRRNGSNLWRILRVSRRVLIVLGIVLIITGSQIPTGAFNSISADRGVGISVSEDANAYLGLDGYADTNSATTFTNNAGESMTIDLTSSEDIEFDTGNNASGWEPAGQFTLSPGDSLDVAVRGSVDNAPVDIGVTLTDGGGATVGSIDATREFAVGDAASIKEIDSSVETNGGNGRYSFTLNNTGTEPVTIVGIIVNDTTTDAYQVSKGDILAASGNQVIESPIVVGSDSISYFGDGQNQTISDTDTQTYKFDRFRPMGNGGGNVDMRNENVRITVYLSDGSSATLDLCYNNNDCSDSF